ncbi:hypothetical protein CRG98_009661 [Punica granatum]|uniref:Uncharacterized protein n=1 Tax=Punica granatum TaxID=22663 RepID=A0A2I0KPR2_PUNGR|nr:hypothetical protein CRG98_009661 [Punica granatum]
MERLDYGPTTTLSRHGINLLKVIPRETLVAGAVARVHNQVRPAHVFGLVASEVESRLCYISAFRTFIQILPATWRPISSNFSASMPPNPTRPNGVATPAGRSYAVNNLTLIPNCPNSTPRFLGNPTIACFDAVCM